MQLLGVEIDDPVVAVVLRFLSIPLPSSRVNLPILSGSGRRAGRIRLSSHRKALSAQAYRSRCYGPSRPKGYRGPDRRRGNRCQRRKRYREIHHSGVTASPTVYGGVGETIMQAKPRGQRVRYGQTIISVPP
jgi:hypothetical protein